MIQNSVKTVALTTRDPPHRTVQNAMVRTTEEAKATLSSAANLREIVRQKRKVEFGHPLSPNTAADLIIHLQI